MKKIFKYFAFFFLFLVACGFEKGFSCTNFLVTKEATVDGSTIISYVADSHELYGELYYWPAKEYKTTDSLKIYEWDTGEFLGTIKQIDHTYQVVGNMNEYQVAIGETTFTGREELQDSTGIIDYGSLIYTALQRAATAREALSVMTSLVAEYGYYSTGESFSVSDKNEVWILELIGKGKGNKGAVWVARKIPAGYISGHANQSRITTFPLNDKENCLYAKDVITFAKSKGYFTGEDKDFSFADAYAPLNFEGARFCEARVWSGFRKVNASMDVYEDYAMGKNLSNRMPLWIKPDRKLTLRDVQEMMRDYYQGTPMDMTKDFGAGPYSCIVRWRPLTWELDGKNYFNERAISTQQTGFSFIAQSRANYPDAIGGILWFGVDDTYSTVYSPMYCGMTRIPGNYAVGNGSLMEFSDSSAFWIFNQLSNFAYTRYADMIPYIKQKQKELEGIFQDQSEKTDSAAMVLFSLNKPEAIRFITDFSVECGTRTVSEWQKLYGFLFTRFMDGNVKTHIEGEFLPKLEQPGYGKEWYRKIVDETGDKFLIEGEVSH